MKIFHLIIISGLLIFTACNRSGQGSEQQNTPETSTVLPNTLTAEEKEKGWELLFDGETTDGWRGFKSNQFPDKGWHATDGVLMIEYSGTGEQGFAGDIITENTFKDFDLKLDWKISPGGNSGILLYVTESDPYEATWHTAHELQVLDDFGYDAIHDYVPTLRQISGSLYDLYTPLCAPAKKVGAWNQARIKIESGHLQHWLNGELVVDVQLWNEEWEERVANSKFNIYPDFGRAREGHIGLQDHGQQVWFRNIRIREL